VALLPQVEEFLALEAFDVPRFRLVFRSGASSLREVVRRPGTPHFI